MNVELWIDASRLQAVLSQLEVQEDCFTEVANIKELALLKQGVAAFIADHASRGSIPSDPLAALQDEPTRTKDIQKFLNEVCWPLGHSFLSQTRYWGVHGGYQQAINVITPDKDFWKTSIFLSTAN